MTCETSSKWVYEEDKRLGQLVSGFWVDIDKRFQLAILSVAIYDCILLCRKTNKGVVLI